MSSEDIRIDSLSPDDEESRGSVYFSTIKSRHAEHFFADMHNHNTQKQKKGIIRYCAYENVNPNRSGTYPSLILNKLSFSKDLRSSSDKALLRLPVLKQEFHNISFEVSSSDVMAIQYTKESEIVSLLRVLCGMKEAKGKISGDILMNGHRMSRDRLEKTIGMYVCM
uniref:Uncharacterized protein n=1 Tax=Caenorhabditis japonica TaxID=281687 RepID=A0A8R1IGA7_CAEJA